MLTVDPELVEYLVVVLGVSEQEVRQPLHHIIAFVVVHETLRLSQALQLDIDQLLEWFEIVVQRSQDAVVADMLLLLHPLGGVVLCNLKEQGTDLHFQPFILDRLLGARGFPLRERLILVKITRIAVAVSRISVSATPLLVVGPVLGSLLPVLFIRRHEPPVQPF